MNKSVVIVATENGALPGGKVGGIADVICGLARAMVARGWRVRVITPAYARLKHIPGFAERTQVTTSFRLETVTAILHDKTGPDGVEHLVLDHPLLTGPEPGRIYYDDPPGQPFATDANRFALFSALVASWLQQQDDVDVVHLNDWHTAPILILRAFDERFANLRARRFIYTIHNLAIQGIRPLRGDPSSLFEWFPDLLVNDKIIDPRYPDCVNLMRSAISLADRVNTVSPGYAHEITLANDPDTNRHGGEYLEVDLKRVGVVGILNGCDYPAVIPGKRRALGTLLERARQEVISFASHSQYVKSAHLVALERISRLPKSARRTLVTGIGRVSPQKLGLLLAPYKGKPLLHHLLDDMDGGIYIMLGSGDPVLETQLTETTASYENFLFLSGFSESLANDLYRSGKLFLMPSSFEPCGISQMLAMRAGQPCLVHAVGGLRDTVVDGITGWHFEGDSIEAQCEALLARFRKAFQVANAGSPVWRSIARQAAAARFTWDDSAAAYEALYNGKDHET